MSFEITSVEGTVQELSVDLSEPTKHEREDSVTPVIKKAIADIVESLGGYLSVSASGNINPVSGETGDVVNIYITSLPNPNPQTTTTPEAAPEVQSGESSSQPASPVTPENVESSSQESAQVESAAHPAETPPVIQENPANT